MRPPCHCPCPYPCRRRSSPSRSRRGQRNRGNARPLAPLPAAADFLAAIGSQQSAAVERAPSLPEPWFSRIPHRERAPSVLNNVTNTSIYKKVARLTVELASVNKYASADGTPIAYWQCRKCNIEVRARADVKITATLAKL